MENFINQLNESQREAVLYDDGPSLVVAGAGSGKTRVLTYKVAHLLQSGYQPHTILALTFTNKAAREMKQRIAAITGEYVAHYLWMGTFHSVFCRILRREAGRIGYPSDFTIYDAADSKNLLKAIIKEMQLDDKVYRPGMIQSRISNAKNALVTSGAYARNKELLDYDMQTRTPMTSDIYQRYQNRCLNAGAMDFDEILLQTNILFRDNPDVLEKYREQFRFVLVDEYQDTNFAQHLIVTKLCEKRRRICVVGDDAQSIYSFRGANIDNMLRFKDNYPDCKIFKLERNYRSTQNIVAAANSLIDKNKEQIKKNLHSENAKGSKLEVLSAYSDYEEGYLVSSKIIDMMRGNGYAYSDFAILYRTNAQSRALEETMRKRTIPYRIYGSQSFYQRKEIKNAIAYFRVLVNPNDEESIRRIINYPMRGIGGTTVEKLTAAAVSANVSLWKVIAAPEKYSVPVNRGAADKIAEFRAMIEDMQAKSKEMTASEIADYTLRRSGMAAMLLQDISVEGVSRQENMQELAKAIADFVAMRREEGSESVSLADFLMEVSLLTDQDDDHDENADKVTLMTVHAAKGLEFRNVFIVGMENDLFPSSRSMDSLRAIEEERRLFYVAITRAKENCIITYARNRFINGRTNAATPSFFLDDIDERYIDFPDSPVLPSRLRRDMEREPFEPSLFKSPGTSWRHEQTAVAPPQRAPRYKRLDRANAPVPATSSAQKVNAIAGLSVGDWVAHERFGEGEIVSLEGEGADAKAAVAFKNAGKKNLLLKYAKLTKIKKKE